MKETEKNAIYITIEKQMKIDKLTSLDINGMNARKFL